MMREFSKAMEIRDSEFDTNSSDTVYDDEIEAVRPPPLPLHEFQDRIVVVPKIEIQSTTSSDISVPISNVSLHSYFIYLYLCFDYFSNKILKTLLVYEGRI